MNIRVDVPGQSYDVVIERGVRHELARYISTLVPSSKQALIIADESLLDEPWFDFDLPVLPSAGGESSKSLAVIEELANELSRREFSRHDVLIAVGGGATTDLVGLLASLYQRGTALISIPTTVAAMADAAIGGKTGVNIAAGKNLLGTFSQPRVVLCDTEVLAGLPDRDRRAGEAEMAKCWLIDGRDPRDYLSASFDERLEQAIGLKARIVSGDEREGGQRALLNYGHTLAHAIEAQHFDDPQAFRHGEAVAIGLVFADALAARLGRCALDRVESTRRLLHDLGLPTSLSAHVDRDALIELMRRDKKAHGALTFVLAGPEGVEVVNNINESDVRSCLDDVVEGAP
jgi:5-deoxy-5-amino-3-dehydroquinate synthase